MYIINSSESYLARYVVAFVFCLSTYLNLVESIWKNIGASILC